MSDTTTKIDLSQKTGLPVGVLPTKFARSENADLREEDYADEDEEEIPTNKGKARPRKETKEEKKARKAAVKAERQGKREQKKMLKSHFQKETRKQEKCSGTRGQSIFTY